MSFYVTKTPQGLYHVQNYVGVYRGQHHIHNEQSFQKWLRQDSMKGENVKISEGNCECGLTQSGQIREYDGREWFNDRFESEPHQTI